MQLYCSYVCSVWYVEFWYDFNIWNSVETYIILIYGGRRSQIISVHRSKSFASMRKLQL